MEDKLHRLISANIMKWKIDHDLELDLGIPTSNSMAFTGIDVFGQGLASVYSGMYGNGGKGSGFDLTDRAGRAWEVKTLCLCQPWRCRGCTRRSPWSSEVCVHCGSAELERMDDSRFGIKADAHVKYADSLEAYCLIAVNYSAERECYTIDMWEIRCDNPYFQLYVKTQHENGSSTCNMLPRKYDFYMSGPEHVLHVDFTLDGGIVAMSLERSIEKMPVHLLRKEEAALVSADAVDGCVDYSVCAAKLTIRAKAHGKERGETTRRH